MTQATSASWDSKTECWVEARWTDTGHTATQPGAQQNLCSQESHRSQDPGAPQDTGPRAQYSGPRTKDLVPRTQDLESRSQETLRTQNPGLSTQDPVSRTQDPGVPQSQESRCSPDPNPITRLQDFTAFYYSLF